jgi:hypothetical protein
MDLDVLFEDLEAQGYFHSKPQVEEASTENSKLVRVELQNNSHLLSSPLLGLDFIAGFELRNNSIRWLIIPFHKIQQIQSVEAGTSLLDTQSDLISLIETKLLGRQIRIMNPEQTIQGILIGISNNCLQIQAEDLLWLPVKSLGVLVVEKFSDLT